MSAATLDAKQPQQAQQNAAQPPKQTDDERLLTNLEILEDSDFKLLAKIIKDHPQLRDKIVARATEVCGSACVAKALAIVAGEAEKEPEVAKPAAAAAPAKEETESQQTEAEESQKVENQSVEPNAAGFDYVKSPLMLEYDHDAKVKDAADLIRKHPHWRTAIFHGMAKWDPDLVDDVLIAVAEPPKHAAEEEKAEEETSEGEQQHAHKKDDHWAMRAIQWNSKHKAIVDEFVKLTGKATIGADGLPDPYLVSDWQKAHGVAADGCIGHQTLTAAKNGAADQAAPTAAPTQAAAAPH